MRTVRMMLRLVSLFNHRIILLLLLCLLPIHADVYENKWAVKIEGGPAVADRLASEHGFRNLGQIGSLENHFLFEHHSVSKRSAEPSHHHHSRLERSPEVAWVEQQIIRKRVKRDFQTPPEGTHDLNIRDPLWPKQWYLHSGATGDFDMNVIPAWKMGYSGRGVVVTILDDGIEHDHPDLHENYDADASWDINNHDADPMPRYDSSNENRHGTRCAGEVAASANNTQCVVGVAFNAKIGGVRMLDGDVSDYVEAQSLSLNPQHIDIYSASWGPDDNGKVVDGPAKLAKEAFVQGVLKGRDGKGSIYVWASGNGGSQDDSCNCDGYTNSIFTLSISSASEHGKKPWYLEECSSTLATTYSSGDNYGEKKIVSTDLHHKCTDAHTGTSASAPLAAGICALALEANPALSWRDMQYIVLMTARPEPLFDGDWIINGMGRKVSPQYGYGLMDATGMVQLASQWTPVPEQRICTSEVMSLNKAIEGKGISISLDSTGCNGTPNYVQYLEHVQAKLTLRYSRRGDIRLRLVSPNGTHSTLLGKRKNDFQDGEFKDWPFMSVHFWGEIPYGTWILHIDNVGSLRNTGVLVEWQLILYGVPSNPVQVQRITPDGQGAGGTWNWDQQGAPTGREWEYNGEEWPASKSGKKGNKNDENESWIPWNGNSKTKPDGYPVSGCHPECADSAGCIGPGAGDCLQCLHVRLGPVGPCVTECPTDGYVDEATAVCHHCVTPCDRCTGIGRNECLSCVKDFSYIPDEHKCVPHCPHKYFSDDSGICSECGPLCASCAVTRDRCTSCPDGFDFANNTCLPQCELHQFRNQFGKCESCHSHCSSCSGAGPSHCVSCQHDFRLQNGSCVIGCSSSFYEAISGGQALCLSCHSSCASCDGPGSDHCLTCVDGLDLVGGHCHQTSCPVGQFGTKASNCQPCDKSCTLCQGPSGGDCLACPPLRYLHEGSCISACPDGFYPENNTEIGSEEGGECVACHPSCVKCSGAGEESCQLCHPGQYVSKGHCVEKCPSGEFVLDGQCKSCHSTCLTCEGPGSSDCTTCSSNLFLWHGECLNECPEGLFKKDEKCQLCHHSCKECKGEGREDCVSCIGELVWHAGKCIPPALVQEPSCGAGFYLDTKLQACQHCDISCATCDGPGTNNCLSCTLPRRYADHLHSCVLCCSQQEPSAGCCNCHPDTGVCMENRNIDLPDISDKDREAASRVGGSETKYTFTERSLDSLKQISNSSNTLLLTVVVACLASVVLFFVIFGLLQAHSSEMLCWRRTRYTPLPMFYQNGTDKVTLTKEDLDDEDEVCSI